MSEATKLSGAEGWAAAWAKPNYRMEQRSFGRIYNDAFDAAGGNIMPKSKSKRAKVKARLRSKREAKSGVRLGRVNPLAPLRKAPTRKRAVRMRSN